MPVSNIATITFKKEDAVSAYFSREYLYKTQHSSTGPLPRIMNWLKAENLYFFDIKHMKLGKEEDAYVFIYYHDGIRYKMMKTGEAVVSSADADDMMEQVEKDLQRLIDTILNDEIVSGLRKVFNDTDGLGSGKIKHVDDEGDGQHVLTVMGARSED